MPGDGLLDDKCICLAPPLLIWYATLHLQLEKNFVMRCFR